MARGAAHAQWLALFLLSAWHRLCQTPRIASTNELFLSLNHTVRKTLYPGMTKVEWQPRTKDATKILGILGFLTVDRMHENKMVCKTIAWMELKILASLWFQNEAILNLTPLQIWFHCRPLWQILDGLLMIHQQLHKRIFVPIKEQWRMHARLSTS